MYAVIDNKKYKLYDCTTLYDRFMGFMFKRNINYSLRFKRCNSIHTFFMLEPIDVVMTDIDNNVLYIFKNLKPWKIVLPKKNVYITYEFPCNSVTDVKRIEVLDAIN